MAYATDIQTNTQNGLVARFNATLVALRAGAARRRIYKETFRELSALSNRELSDLGLSRSEIRRVAWQAAYEM